MARRKQRRQRSSFVGKRYRWHHEGAEVNVESLKSLVSGGINFATPDEAKGGEPVKDGTLFRLYDEPKKEWLEWAPAISVGRDPR